MLIVDDESSNRKLLADLVVREGYEALTAEGGAEALALLADGSIDVLLLDVMMPGIDGMEVLAELQRRGMLPALPVVIVTAHDDRKVRVDALSGGAIEFLTKPIDRVEVGCRLRTLVELKRLRDVAKIDAATARAQLLAVVENAPDVVISVDRQGSILSTNRALPQHTREEVVGSPWVSFLRPEERGAVEAALTDVIETGTTRAFEIHSEGPLTLEARVGPVRLNEKIVGAVIIARDVTEKKRTEMQLMISERMASVGTLASGVAHEINNPLAAVVANLELTVRDVETLAERHDDGELGDMREALRDARDAADRIRLIVRDLKTFSRGDEPEQVAPVDVRRVLDSTLRMAWNELQHRARVTKDYEPGPLVVANESRLGQVFLNLVVNAAQAIPEGDAEHNEIRISNSTDPMGRVQVDIRDTGPGMAPDVLRRLFTPFFTTKPVGVGTGLGLSICHRIVTSMGGEIQIESQVGKGTTFRVLLPPAARELVEPPQVHDDPPPPEAVRRGSILVVDDEPMIGQAIRRTLGKEHDVTVVVRAEDALGLLRAQATAFDVIFCDLMMPQMTGMDLYEHLASNGGLEPASRIVFLTGGAFTARARQFLDRVPNLRLEKPFDSVQLRTLVNDRISSLPE